MTTKLICCDVFKEEIVNLNPPNDMDMEFISMGLHLHPAKLHQEIQSALDRVTGYSQVILGFGLCGGSLDGIKAPSCPMILPKVHDCIPVLLGSQAKYDALQQKNNKAFYFSGGWVEGDRMIIPEHERAVIKFGPKKAMRILNVLFENYNQLRYIHTGHPRHDETLAKTQEFADIVQLPCKETIGCLDYLQLLLHGPWDEEHFVMIPANGTVQQESFLGEGQEIGIQGV